ncbi:MAG: DUF6151 family protein [Cellvibrionales bacterium]|nr:DUF6151 family protein [Cellvibrionales bacterium]
MKIACQCGNLQGEITDLTPRVDRHIICCCDDCQAFARFLQQDGILDASGGTQIVQMTPSQIHFSKGESLIACIRLTPNGVYRWYASCCSTPIANTLSSGVPFMGVIHSIIKEPEVVEEIMGPPSMVIQAKHAIVRPLHETQARGFPLSLLLSTARRLIVAKLKGQDKPNPFFNDKKPLSEPKILSQR